MPASFLLTKANIVKNIAIPVTIINLKFFINIKIKKHPNKNKMVGILLPASNKALECKTIAKIDSVLPYFLFLKDSKM